MAPPAVESLTLPSKSKSLVPALTPNLKPLTEAVAENHGLIL
jgi:hypothetical protein